MLGKTNVVIPKTRDKIAVVLMADKVNRGIIVSGGIIIAADKIITVINTINHAKTIMTRIANNNAKDLTGALITAVNNNLDVMIMAGVMAIIVSHVGPTIPMRICKIVTAVIAVMKLAIGKRNKITHRPPRKIKMQVIKK